MTHRLIVTSLLLLSMATAQAQEAEHPFVIVNGSYDIPFSPDEYRTEGYGFGAHYLFGADWGLGVEYSSFSVSKLQRTLTGSYELRFTASGPAVLIHLHPALTDRVAILAAAGFAFLSVDFSQERFLFGSFSGKEQVTIFQAKLGLRVRVVGPIHVFVNASIHHLASAGLMVAI